MFSLYRNSLWIAELCSKICELQQAGPMKTATFEINFKIVYNVYSNINTLGHGNRGQQVIKNLNLDSVNGYIIIK